jgi:hypothetical protein
MSDRPALQVRVPLLFSLFARLAREEYRRYFQRRPRADDHADAEFLPGFLLSRRLSGCEG